VQLVGIGFIVGAMLTIGVLLAVSPGSPPSQAFAFEAVLLPVFLIGAGLFALLQVGPVRECASILDEATGWYKIKANETSLRKAIFVTLVVVLSAGLEGLLLHKYASDSSAFSPLVPVLFVIIALACTLAITYALFEFFYATRLQTAEIQVDSATASPGKLIHTIIRQKIKRRVTIKKVEIGLLCYLEDYTDNAPGQYQHAYRRTMRHEQWVVAGANLSYDQGSMMQIEQPVCIPEMDSPVSHFPNGTANYTWQLVLKVELPLLPSYIARFPIDVQDPILAQQQQAPLSRIDRLAKELGTF
jgi:hypothetical protein